MGTVPVHGRLSVEAVQENAPYAILECKLYRVGAKLMMQLTIIKIHSNPTDPRRMLAPLRPKVRIHLERFVSFFFVAATMNGKETNNAILGCKYEVIVP